MKIIILSVGTRGDMEPFLAIAEILKQKGHQVICAFPEQFRSLADESDVKFHSLGEGFIDMLDSEVGRNAMGGGGSGFKKLFAILRLTAKQTTVNKELVYNQRKLVDNEFPDRIVYNGKAIYPVIWEVDNRGKSILISPVPYLHYVRGNTHVAFNSNLGPLLNKLTFSLAKFGLVTTTKIAIKWLKTKNQITGKQIKQILSTNKVIYTISPSLFSRPDYWRSGLNVLGYHGRTRLQNWQPDKSLEDFLEKHQNILFISFGSMTNPNPDQKTKMIVEILTRNNIPAILNTASGGLVKLETYDSDLVYFIKQIPYDWIFPKIYAIIHHGGSGTTHVGLKYGCATLIIPHIIDQFVWNNIIHKIGAGPKGIKIGKLTTRNLEPKLLDLLCSRNYKTNAENIAKKMGKEDFREDLYQSIIR
jgi:UDP:flavonoid glycosyltransferase YjiC (YdhE family)